MVTITVFVFFVVPVCFVCILASREYLTARKANTATLYDADVVYKFNRYKHKVDVTHKEIERLRGVLSQQEKDHG